jgi:hypothetical protein
LAVDSFWSTSFRRGDAAKGNAKMITSNEIAERIANEASPALRETLAKIRAMRENLATVSKLALPQRRLRLVACDKTPDGDNGERHE